jgi:CBS domain-containing protein
MLTSLRESRTSGAKQRPVRLARASKLENPSVMNPNGTIQEILGHKGSRVWSISPDAMVFDAIQLMSDKNVGALLVLQDEKLVGIISERDYTRKVALKGKSSKQTAVKEILSGHLIQVTPEHTVEECMRLMTDHRVRHLPVLEGDQVLGVVSIGDLVNWIISAQSSTIHQLQTYISGYPE